MRPQKGLVDISLVLMATILVAVALILGQFVRDQKEAVEISHDLRRSLQEAHQEQKGIYQERIRVRENVYHPVYGDFR